MTRLSDPPPRLKRAWAARDRNRNTRRELFQYALASGLKRKHAAYIAGISYSTASKYHREITK